jgi:hypothetical protein
MIMKNEYPPYEYCALRFLLQWERKERALFKKLSKDPSPKEIREALGYFRAARGFNGLKTKANKVVSALKKNTKGLNRKNVITRVNSLADDFKRDFGSRNLSAASKLLWLSQRSPVVIMDSRSKTALHNLGYNLSNGDYEAYYNCWRYEFNSRNCEIKKVVKKLSDIKIFTSSWKRTLKEFKQDLIEEWFIERTFDLFLWEIADLG